MNLFRSILIKLVYKDKYDKVGESMFDSNVAAHTKQNIRNYILFINAIINKGLRTKKNIHDSVALIFEAIKKKEFAV